MNLSKCTLCPRMCGADREKSQGYCGAGKNIRIARADLHYWEEPCISGKSGSGAVFFSSCPLKCVFCQNYKISSENFGKDISVKRLSEIFLELQDKGAMNINLVSATPYVPIVVEALDNVKGKLTVPVVYNTSSYENIETLRMLEGYVDIYLPDMKYYDSSLSKKYSGTENYFDIASKAIKEMVRQTGNIVMKDGMMKKGVIIRHLVMPSMRRDSLEILDWIEKNFTKEEIMLSLMSQFTPFYKCSQYPEINRRVSTFEYNVVLKKAQSLDFEGFMQEKSSAKEEYTPDFDLSGI